MDHFLTEMHICYTTIRAGVKYKPARVKIPKYRWFQHHHPNDVWLCLSNNLQHLGIQRHYTTTNKFPKISNIESNTSWNQVSNLTCFWTASPSLPYQKNPKGCIRSSYNVQFWDFGIRADPCFWVDKADSKQKVNLDLKCVS